MAARSFSVVMEDSEDVLNKKCNIRTTIFYKQRFFEHVFPMLNNTLEVRDDEIRPYIVKAIMFLAKHTTASTLLARADSVLPLVLEAISSDDIESCIVSLNTCSIIVAENLNLMKEHVDTIIPRVLDLTREVLNKNPFHRVLALDILLELLRLPYLCIHKFKTTVLDVLGKSIDDTSRIVRRKAVKVRNEWFVVNGEDQF